jgi:hypothetical protein
MKASSFFSEEQQAKILASVREAEEATSGEIRVHIETSFKGDVLDRAAWVFGKLGMHKTALRNGGSILPRCRGQEICSYR